MPLKYSLIFILLMIAQCSLGQNLKELTTSETKQLQAKTVATPSGIYKAFEYKDIDGIHNIAFYENRKKVIENYTTNSNISASCYLKYKGKYILKWKITDQLEKSKYDSSFNDINITFSTKYCTSTDLNGDNLVDPIIVYKTETKPGPGRVNVILFCKGKKYAIRAVECDVDYCRTFVKDISFKNLPEKIQRYINQMLEKMRTEDHLILNNH